MTPSIARLGTFLFSLLFSSAPIFTWSQCGQLALNAATRSYESGLLTEAKQELITCFRTTKFEDLKLTHDAFRMLALVAIAEDSLSLANRYIRRILQADPDYQGPTRHFLFDRMVKQQLEKNQTVTVSAVSKRAEDIRSAPASVLLLRGEEIRERGYMDLIDVLSNLPGFDISKYYGVTYANVYQLGFRQENTERTLLLINGVEENDNWSNIAYICRQYPLSDIKAVEVLYGPSSTMYGPRAFVGAINIITYDPGEATPFPRPKAEEGETSRKNPFFLSGHLQGGSFQTRDIDLTFGFRKEAVKTSITFKSFGGNQLYDQQFDFFNYKPSDVDILNYDHLHVVKPVSLHINGVTKTYTPNDYANLFGLDRSTPDFTLFRNSAGLVDSIRLTAQGITKARELDRAAYTGPVNGFPSGQSNQMRDGFLGVKISFPNLVLGIRAWTTEESFGFYQDLYNAGTRNGNRWAISNATFYSIFSKSYNRFSFSNITSFTNNRLDQKTARVNYFLLGNRSLPLHLAHFVYPDSLLPTATSSPARQGYGNLYYYYDAQLFRNDFRFFYTNERLQFMSGLEFRFSQQFGDYLYYLDFPREQKILDGSNTNAQDKGSTVNPDGGGNIYSIFDIGLYFSGTYQLIPSRLQLSFGNRIDNNTIRSSGGFGTEFTPRLALILLGKEVSAKMVLSRGIQNVSLFQRYSTGNSRKPNPNLETEKVYYLDASLNGVHFDQRLRWNLMAYNFFVSDAVASVSINERPFTNQNQNVGLYHVFGTMFDVQHVFPDKKWSVFFNHSLTFPYQEPSLALRNKRLRIADISTHKANAGITYRQTTSNHLLSGHFFVNLVGPRPIGWVPLLRKILGLGARSLYRPISLGMLPSTMGMRG